MWASKNIYGDFRGKKGKEAIKNPNAVWSGGSYAFWLICTSMGA
jgi:hypothetical protein